jgi:hypothetical protein
VTTAQDGDKVVSLMHRPHLPPGIQLVLIFVRSWVDPRAIARSEGFMSMKNSNVTFWHRTKDFPICSAVTLTTVLPRSPHEKNTALLNILGSIDKVSYSEDEDRTLYWNSTTFVPRSVLLWKRIQNFILKFYYICSTLQTEASQHTLHVALRHHSSRVRLW